MTVLRTAIAVLLLTLIPAGAVFAQAAGKIIEYPPKVEDIRGLMVLKNQLNAKIDYVGRKYSVDMWVASKEGVSQIIYTTLDGRGLLTNGFLFDEDGNVVTEKQMVDVQKDEPSVVENKLRDFSKEIKKTSSGDEFWKGLNKLDTVSFGSEKAPLVYVFADPMCSFCKKYWKTLEPRINDGSIQVRIVPVGILGKQSADAAAALLDEIDKQSAWLRITKGIYTFSKKPSTESMAKIGANSIYMKDWEIISTPFTVYRNKFGKVRLLRGAADDMTPIIDEMTK